MGKKKQTEENTENKVDNAPEKENACQDTAEKTVLSDEKAQLEQKLEQAQNELKAANEKYLRCAAEFDNFKRRTIKEKEQIYKDSVADTVLALLPVADNLERALASFTDKDNDYYKGVEMVLKQTEEVFKKLGVEVIKAVGEEFNPELHNAVMHTQDDKVADNTVVEEFQKGYTYKDKVIRYSMVKVAN